MRARVFPTKHAPGQIRRLLSPLAGSMDQGSLAALRSVVSELVNVSVAHGASKPIDLNLEILDGEIQGLIDDHGPGTRAMIRAKQRRDRSLVLRIIDGLVIEWDASSAGVWFRLPMRNRGSSAVRRVPR